MCLLTIIELFLENNNSKTQVCDVKSEYDIDTNNILDIEPELPSYTEVVKDSKLLHH